jgi:hypothetical protein
MATVESSDMDVMVEFGVPLRDLYGQLGRGLKGAGRTYGMSEGVTGSEGGGGRLIKVGALDIATVCI